MPSFTSGVKVITGERIAKSSCGGGFLTLCYLTGRV
jgi:hypothetical protein